VSENCRSGVRSGTGCIGQRLQKAVPVFEAAAPSGAILSDITFNQIQGTSVELAFKQAQIPAPNSGNEVVHSYRFDFINKNTGVTEKSVKQWSDFMLTPRLQNPVYTQIIGGLTSVPHSAANFL